jgi:hypothetical protein
MSDVQAPAQRPNLEIGSIMSGTFSLLFARFWYFAGVTFLSMLAIVIIVGAGFGGSAALIGVGPATDISGASVALMVLTGLVALVLGLGLYLTLTHSAVTMRLGQGVQFGRAFGAALAGLPAFLLLGIVIYVMVLIGFLLFVVPGLYIAAIFTVIMPIIAYERAGFGSLGRSFALTKGYRWAIVGLNLIWLGISIAVSVGLQLVTTVILFGTTAGGLGDPPVGAAFFIGLAVSNILSVLVYCIVVPLGTIFPAVLYARLIEIKEGGGAEALQSVFE